MATRVPSGGNCAGLVSRLSVCSELYACGRVSMREIGTHFVSCVCALVIVQMLRNELRTRVGIGS